MDSFLSVFKEIADFFIYYCSVVVDFGGIEFPIGAMFIWAGLAGLVLMILRRMA